MNRTKVTNRIIAGAFAINMALSITAGAQVGKKPPIGAGKGKPVAGAPAAGADKAAPAGPPVPAIVHHKGKDPFYIPWTVPPPPPYVFDKILPVRVADEEVEAPPKEPTTVREEPTLRVSGIMTGDGVFAILEKAGGQVDIVKPGSTVDVGNGRTYTVTEIKGETVVLESKDGLVTYQQSVPLSDAPIGTTSAAFGSAPTGGRPGAMSPGSFGGGGKRGGGMMPGGMTPGGFGNKGGGGLQKGE